MALFFSDSPLYTLSSSPSLFLPPPFFAPLFFCHALSFFLTNPIPPSIFTLIFRPTSFSIPPPLYFSNTYGIPLSRLLFTRRFPLGRLMFLESLFSTAGRGRFYPPRPPPTIPSASLPHIPLPSFRPPRKLAPASPLDRVGHGLFCKFFQYYAAVAGVISFFFFSSRYFFSLQLFVPFSQQQMNLCRHGR